MLESSFRLIETIGLSQGKGRLASEGVEVRGYFEEWIKNRLSKTHSICIWHFKPDDVAGE